MDWVKYNSIINLTSSMMEKEYEPKSVNIPTYPNIQYVGIEKVHGSNFSIICDIDNTISYARRKDKLKKDERFHDYLNVMEQHQDCIKKIKTEIEKINTAPVLITIYGELFGGKYNHVDVPKQIKMAAVQKEIDYHPNFKFIPFDIKVNNKFLNWNKFVELIKETNFKLLEPLIRGDYNTVINFEVEKQITKIPLLYNLPPIRDNFMEGIVIKPTEDLYDKRHNRIIIKKKTKQFTEKKLKPKNVIEVPEKIRKLTNEIGCYITPNRLNNVISKELEITKKDFGRLIKLLLEDSFDEYQKENENPSAKDTHLIRKALMRSAVYVVTDYFDKLVI